MLKRLIKALGVALLILLIIVMVLVQWIGLGDLPRFEKKSLSTIHYTDSTHLALGEHIVSTRCAYCHLGEDGRLSGRLFTPVSSPFGEMWTKNITQSSAHGIGSYTDGELAWLLRTGIKHDGYFAGPYMSSPLASDEDINCIISFLRSNHELVKASEFSTPTRSPRFLEKALQKFGVFAPLEYDGKPRPSINPADTVVYGKYLVQARYECSNCHSKSFETYNPLKPEDSPGYMGGGNEVQDRDMNLIRTANISPSMQYGIGSWTFEQFSHAVRGGQSPTGSNLSLAMPRIVSISDSDLMAIWTYLHSVKAIDVDARAK